MLREDTTQKLVDTFTKIDESTKLSLANIENPLLLGLIALAISEDRAGCKYLSADEIVAALEATSISVNKNSIVKAFARAGKKINQRMEDGETLYRIMIPGRKEVELLTRQDALTIAYIEGGKPRTARKILSEILQGLSGEVRICDPYYGIRTLDALDYILPKCNVRFLSSQTSENLIKLHGAINDFKREHQNTEFRLSAEPKALHDRYILSSESLYLLGHGIKDIGNKESFIVGISKDYAEDVLESLSG